MTVGGCRYTHRELVRDFAALPWQVACESHLTNLGARMEIVGLASIPNMMVFVYECPRCGLYLEVWPLGVLCYRVADASRPNRRKKPPKGGNA